MFPFLHDVQKAKAIDDSFLYLYYPRQKQLLLMEKIKDVRKHMMEPDDKISKRRSLQE